MYKTALKNCTTIDSFVVTERFKRRLLVLDIPQVPQLARAVDGSSDEQPRMLRVELCVRHLPLVQFVRPTLCKRNTSLTESSQFTLRVEDPSTCS